MQFYGDWTTNYHRRFVYVVISKVGNSLKGGVDTQSYLERSSPLRTVTYAIPP